jgi:hypothetical protein
MVKFIFSFCILGLVFPDFAEAAIAFRVRDYKSGFSATSISDTEPAGILQDDIVIMSLALASSATGVSLDVADGWNQIYSGTSAGGASTHIWWIRRGNSAPTYSVSWSGTSSADLVISAWSGVIPLGDPILTLAETTYVSGGAVNPPAITTTIPNTMVIAIGSHASDYSAGGCGGIAGYTKRFNVSFYSFCIAEKALASAATEDPGNMNNQSSAGYRVGITLALIPDSVSVGKIKLQDLPAGGTFSVSLRSANAVSSDLSFVLPSNYGSNGQVMTTNGSGTLSWSSVSPNKVRVCEISVGDEHSFSPPLSDTTDSPNSCGNLYGQTLTITSIECSADAGSPTVMPKITGGANLLSGNLTCGSGSFSSGTLNGTPTQAANETIDGNIVSAGGTAKRLIIRITRTLP